MKRSTQPARKLGKKLLQLRSLIEATVNNTTTHPSPLALPALSLKSLESKFADGFNSSTTRWTSASILRAIAADLGLCSSPCLYCFGDRAMNTLVSWV